MEPSQAPIVRRIERMHTQWQAFCETDLTVFVWRFEPNARRMVDAFVAWSNALDNRTMFVRLDAPWGDDYAGRLSERLGQTWSSVEEELSELGFAPWYAPANAADFAGTLRSFAEHVRDVARPVVAVLEPGPEGSDFIHELARGLAGTDIRVVWAAYGPEEGDDVVVSGVGHAETAGLDMASAPLEVAHAANTGDPAGTFRVAFLELGEAARVGDVAESRRTADAALQIAEAQGWDHLVITVWATLAGVLAGAGSHDEAIALWRDGQARCDAVDDAPWKPSLAVQTRMGLGGVQVMAGRFADAVGTYEDASGVAESVGDALMAFEGARMASWCAAQCDAPGVAWQHGERALDLAEPLEAQVRREGTLPWLGVMLEDVAGLLGKDVGALSARLDDLSGPGWRARGTLG
jgi:hypothetical protein